MPIAIEIAQPTQVLRPGLKQRAPLQKATAVSKLPGATLASIFHIALLEPSGPSTTYSVYPLSQTSRVKTTLSLSQVNSLWRDTSLSLPELWLSLLESELDSDVNEVEHPLYTRKQWLKILFHRSDPLPINIGQSTHPDTYYYLPRDPELVGQEMEYIHRIRTYRVFLDERGWETLSSCLDQPADALETMSLAYRPATIGFAPRQYQQQPQHPHLPKNIVAPRLSKLSLRGCLPDFSSSCLRETLTSLTVSQVSGPGIIVPSADRWLAHLSGMPRLQHLVLKDGAISSSRYRQKRSLSTRDLVVELPLLQSLTLEGNVDAIGTIARRLNFPVESTMSVVCLGAGESGIGVEAVLEAFGRKLEYQAGVTAKLGPGPRRSSVSSSFLSLVVSSSNSSTLHISDGTPSRHLIFRLSLEAPEGSTTATSLGASMPVWETILSKFLELVPLTMSSLTTLEAQLPFTPPCLVKSLSQATKLERLLNLTGHMSKQLFPQLQKDLPSTGVESSPSAPSLPLTVQESNSLSSLTPLPLLPALHTLHFSNSADVFLNWGPAGTAGCGCTSALQNYLKWRSLGWRAIRVVQVPVDRLDLGGVPEEMVDFLQGLNICLLYV